MKPMIAKIVILLIAAASIPAAYAREIVTPKVSLPHIKAPNVGNAGNSGKNGTLAGTNKSSVTNVGGNVKGSHSSGGDRPTENWTFDYTKMGSAYKPQNTPSGTSGSSYTPPVSEQDPTVSVNTRH